MSTTKGPRLMLRTVAADMTSRGGYKWKASGVNVAPDWNPAAECGGGLHGLLNGQGDAGLLDWSDNAIWMVAKPGRELVDIDGDKVKCKRATTVYCGDRAGALAVLRDAGVTDVLPGDIVTAGDGGQATAGHYGQAMAGHYGQAMAGNHGQATAGQRGQATAGHWGQATAGDCGQATAGHWGQATAGDCGQATAGHWGQATAGQRGQATAGRRGQATAGDGGVISVRWHDRKRYRLAVGYVGEDGIAPNVAYRCDDSGRLVPVNTKGTS